MNKHDRMAEVEIKAYTAKLKRDQKEIARRERMLARLDREWYRKTLSARLADLGTSNDERRFWIEFYNSLVGQFAAEFGPKYTPETFAETDRMNVGQQDWTAVIEAIRHIQSFLGQHDRDHDAFERAFNVNRDGEHYGR